MEEKRIKAIVTFIRGLLDETKASLSVSEDLAFLLLDRYHWDHNELISNWEASKDELIESFHIHIDGENTLEEKLAYKDSGYGSCPVCKRDNRRLYELYCGHKICKDCLQEDVKNAVIKSNIPVCHQDCNAEMLAHDVEKILPGSKHAKAYKWWRLNKSYSESHYNVALCPNPLCKHLIVQKDDMPTKLVHCPKCDYAFCMDCLKDSHNPLKCCKRVVDFTETLKDQLKELEEEEVKWFKRESKVIEYRFQNKNETAEGFDIQIRSILHAQKEEQDEVEQQIKNTDLFSDQILTEISQAEDKIKELVKKNKSPEKVEELNKKVADLRVELDHYRDFKEELEKENEARKEKRKNELEFAQKQKETFMKSILNREKNQLYIQQFKDNLNNFAEERSKQIINENDYIRSCTYVCPQCKQRFFKVNPCCEVTCFCGYDFCTLCNEAWVTHKKGYCECQNEAGEKQINYEDPGELLFYPCRFNLERKTFFAKWTRFHNLYLAEKTKHDELHQKFLQAEGAPFANLVKRLQQENVEEPRTVALRLVSNALFAQNVAAWGYAATFYVRISELTQGYLEKLEKLTAKNAELIELINQPNEHSAKDFQQKLAEVKDEVDLVLRIKF